MDEPMTVYEYYQCSQELCTAFNMGCLTLMIMAAQAPYLMAHEMRVKHRRTA